METTNSATQTPSGPLFSSRRKPSSSRIGTPSSTALSYFDPGESPATTYAVFFDTELAAFPPRATMASLASSRENTVSDPVTTIDRPSSVRSTLVSRSSAIRTPAARHLSMIARCQSTVNHSTTAAAIVGPTPSTAANCSSDAALIASRLPYSVASARGAGGARPRGGDGERDEPPPQRAGLRLVQIHEKPRAVGRQAAVLGLEQFGAQQVAAAEREQVSLVADDAGRQKRDRRLVTEAFDVECTAAGDVKHPLPQLRRARPGVRAADVGVALLGRSQLGTALGTRGGH